MRWIERGWEGGDRRVSKLANRPTAYPLYPPGITKPTCDPMYHRRERERENLPIHFYHSLSISKFRHLPPPLFIQHSASRNIFQLCLRRHSPVRYMLPRDEGRRLPSFRIASHFPRLINFTRTRILIMTYMHRFVTMNSYDDESIERINGVFFFFFLSLFSLVSRILFFFLKMISLFFARG